MPVVEWTVAVGFEVEARDGYIGTITEIFQGPARNIFVSSEPYMLVGERGQPDLYIPFAEIVDVSEVKQVVYLKRFLREIDPLGWTRDPRRPDGRAIPYQPRTRARPPEPDKLGAVPPRPRVESGQWQPAAVAPRAEPGRGVRIGDRFKPGDPIPVEAQYMCTTCMVRKHSRQMRADNPDGKFPPPHHPGALWELEDLRP